MVAGAIWLVVSKSNRDRGTGTVITNNNAICRIIATKRPSASSLCPLNHTRRCRKKFESCAATEGWRHLSPLIVSRRPGLLRAAIGSGLDDSSCGWLLRSSTILWLQPSKHQPKTTTLVSASATPALKPSTETDLAAGNSLVAQHREQRAFSAGPEKQSLCDRHRPSQPFPADLAL